ncbi:beta-ketoacyl-ACP synthase III [Ilumatobacter coccineus]|uniref:Beta-ketoacyl-[acyl-carrier-protein] synthase III n=1 Tax=Ilumatobacter coccineus (strain NBRC 103263 / KCTC 29153 / YM16-304) TaxID=1313172 RepID=A0A6C7E6Q3_ILUCY|nr:beta-ketoacyl-ACP synthase III [Ilumatobacter coccineus]BAN02447.1 3-oxoacyl-[acyl-carrier-protein] synthase III [Ilumatobacter coccineus YM16-304]
MPAIPPGVRGAVITGWGAFLPEKVVTNADLEKTMDTNDEWIRERTGIHERHVGGSTSELSIQSGRAALEMAGVDPSEIDALILATTTPDRHVPATASSVQLGLGLSCGASDLNAACSGWVYGLVNAHGLIAMGARKVLVIGTDTLDRITDYTDRNTGILFGNGSGAAVFEAVEGPGQLLGWDLDSIGEAESALYCEIGGTLEMEGREVFRRAVRIMVDSGNKSMEAAGVSPDDIKLVIPHQANIRIISAAMERIGIPEEKAMVNLHRTGNTSAASVPMALAEALDEGRVDPGDLILFVGFGAGMTAASAVVRWMPDATELPA